MPNDHIPEQGRQQAEAVRAKDEDSPGRGGDSPAHGGAPHRCRIGEKQAERFRNWPRKLGVADRHRAALETARSEREELHSAEMARGAARSALRLTLRVMRRWTPCVPLPTRYKQHSMA
jgi:hypothetical protein